MYFNFVTLSNSYLIELLPIEFNPVILNWCYIVQRTHAIYADYVVKGQLGTPGSVVSACAADFGRLYVFLRGVADEEGVNLVLAKELISLVAMPFLCLVHPAQTVQG